MMRIVLIGLVFAFHALAQAQPLYKNKFDWQGQGGVQAEAYQQQGSFAFGSLHARSGNALAGRIGTGSLVGWSAQAGYERLFSAHWQIGAYYQLERTAADRLRQGTLYARHNGKLASLVFLKEIGWSRLDYQLAQLRDTWQWHAAAYLGKRFPLGRRYWQIGLHAYAWRYTNPPGDARRISGTQLRIRADVPLSERLAITVFLEKRASYFFGLPQDRYDKDGNLIESIPYHKLNQVQPLAGLSVRCLIHPSGMNASAPFNLWKP